MIKRTLIYLDVESRTGCLFCQMCDDFVWDPTLEELRMRKFGTGTFSSKSWTVNFWHYLESSLFQET